MRNIVFIGDCKPLITPLINTLLHQPSIEMRILNSVRIITDRKTYRCIYTEGSIDSRMVDYLHTCDIAVVCYDVSGDRIPYCGYWINIVRCHVPNIHIMVVGIQTKNGAYMSAEDLCRRYHLPHIISNPLVDKSVKEYIDTRYPVTEDSSCCCWM